MIYYERDIIGIINLVTDSCDEAEQAAFGDLMNAVIVMRDINKFSRKNQRKAFETVKIWEALLQDIKENK